MKKRIWIVVLAVLLVAAIVAGVVACGGKKGENKNNQSVTSQPYYVDEETGDIIDAATGEKTDNENLVVDEETGDIIDKTTNETVVSRPEAGSKPSGDKNTGKPSGSTSSKPSSNTKPNSNTNTNTNTNTKPSTNEGSKPSGSVGGGNTDSGTNGGGNGGNDTDILDDIVLPTSSKKISFNRQKLYNEMVALYEKPKYPELIYVMSKDDFFHQINGTVPPEIQYIVDWYFAVYDKKGPESITCSLEHGILFNNIRKSLLNVSICSGDSDENNMTISTTYDRINTELDKAYYSYSHNPTTDNRIAISSYNYWTDIYNKNVANTEDTCNKVASALAKAGVKNGENEVTAINKIIKYMCDYCEYGYGMVELGDGLGCHIQDFFNFKQAVCDGYAKTFWAMCKYCNIDVEYHAGKTADGEEHAWNSIKVNGKDYYFDVTWHDIQLGSDLKTAQRIWCTKAEFDKDHIRESSKIYYW